MSLPHEAILEPSKVLVANTGAFLPPTAKRAVSWYRVPFQGYEHFYTHPLPGSLVVLARNEESHFCFFVLWGRRKNTSGLQYHISTLQTLLARYNFSMWDNILKFLDKLSEESRHNFQARIEEDKLVARTSLQAALNGADLVSRVKMSTLTMCRCWHLQSSGIPPVVQQTIQDLPF